MTRSLVLAGNFNLTNIDELFRRLIELGQYPPATTDTVTILERIGHFLDRENDDKYRYFKDKGYSKQQITDLLAKHIDLKEVVSLAARRWDGGYVMAGMIGHGDAFVMRDPCGIRPALLLPRRRSSRGRLGTRGDPDRIQQALRAGPGTGAGPCADRPPRRGLLGRTVHRAAAHPPLLVRTNLLLARKRPRHLPRTQAAGRAARAANPAQHRPRHRKYGFLLYSQYGRERLFRTGRRIGRILPAYPCRKDSVTRTARSPNSGSRRSCGYKPRFEKVAIKDVKMRTFITQDNDRDDLVAHVYDITYGTIRAGKDNLVILDDSIVRGTTLRQSIVRILDRLEPRKIVVCSSAPQIRYPDCYGIDMSRLGDFVAFRGRRRTAARKRTADAHRRRLPRMSRAIARRAKPSRELRQTNLRAVHRRADFGQDRADHQGAGYPLAGRSDLPDRAENMHEAIPAHGGDWYFTGDYPTPGGNAVADQAFVNFLRETQRKSILNRRRPSGTERATRRRKKSRSRLQPRIRIPYEPNPSVQVAVVGAAAVAGHRARSPETRSGRMGNLRREHGRRRIPAPDRGPDRSALAHIRHGALRRRPQPDDHLFRIEPGCGADRRHRGEPAPPRRVRDELFGMEIGTYASKAVFTQRVTAQKDRRHYAEGYRRMDGLRRRQAVCRPAEPGL